MKRTLLIVLTICALIFPIMPEIVLADDTQPAVCNGATSADIIQACADYASENAKLKSLQNQLIAQKQKSGSLQKGVNALVSQITSTQGKIRDKISAIASLSLQITQKQQAIGLLNTELDKEHSSMGQILKNTNELDQKGSEYVLLSATSVTNFYQDLDDFISIKQSLYASLNHVKQIKSLTQTQQQQLQDKQYQALDAKNALLDQKKRLAVSQQQAAQLLASSKGQEQIVALSVADQQKKVAAIQSKLFSFAGGATKAIPFKDAYSYAQVASTATGVRPAFILAILTQESSLGKNVGTCNRATDPISKKWQNIMPGPSQKASGQSSRDDQTVFLSITKALGLDPDTTPLSCPIAGGGWGGAMGPSQFIPSTWQLIAPQVASALGVGTANPWRAPDAIMATAIYLENRGGTGSDSNERNAACKYYSGRSCDGKRPANSFYGNSVMSLARSIQSDIDYLQQYGVSRR